MTIKRLLIMTAAAGLFAPLLASASQPYCVAVNGGFGNGGASFIARGFNMPDPSKCTPWAGYTKTAATVIETTTGTACMSDDGTVLTLSLFSVDPDFLGTGKQALDYIRVCPNSVTNCPIGGGQDLGDANQGAAAEQWCSDDLLDLPTFHD